MRKRVSRCAVVLMVFSFSLAAFAASTSRVVFTRPDIEAPYDHEVWIMNDDGTEQIKLTNNGLHPTLGTPIHDVEGKLCGGNRIVFSSNRDGVNYDIWIMNTDGTGATNLTPGAGVGTLDSEPECDSTGLLTQTVVFRSNVDNLKGEIYTVPANGGSIVRLTNDDFFDDDPSWCGSQILYIGRRNPVGQPESARWNEIILMDQDGLNKRRQTCDDMEQASPTCHPSGMHIATSDRDWISLGGPDPFPGTATIIYRFPVCNPDPGCCGGTAITCCGSCCYSPEIRTQLSFVGPENNHPTWSPEGLSIFFSSNREIMDPTSSTDYEIYEVHGGVGENLPAGGFLNRLTGGPAPEQQVDDTDPAWGAAKRP